MAETQPSYEQALCYTASDDRVLLNDLVKTEGVANEAGGSLLVTTGGAGLDLFVAEGGGFVDSDTDDEGMYHVFNDATETVTATTADGTNPRIDQVIATVRDSQISGLDNDWVLSVLAGTPTGGATLTNLTGAAALPDRAIRLAYVLVPAGFAGPFVNATHILDGRTSYQTGEFPRWHTIGGTGEPAFTNSWVNFGGSTNTAQYRRRGDLVEVRGQIKSGTAATAFTLPVGYRPPADLLFVTVANNGAGIVISTLTVTSAGAVNPGTTGSTLLSLDTVRFSVTA